MEISNLQTQTNNFKELEKHPYFATLVEKALIPIMQAKKRADDEKVQFEPTPVEQYHIDVFYRSASLHEAIKRLYDIPYFLMSNPSFKSLANHGVSPQDWFIYHYSNYRVIATGIYDTALIVTNVVLQINLPAKKCNNDSIRKNPKTIETQIDIPLKSLDLLIEKYREERNLYVHRSERPEIEFVDLLNGYRFLREAKEKGLYKGELPQEKAANALFIEQRNKKRAELVTETQKICSAIIQLCDVWRDAYLEVLSSY
jgi:hypothetical protein